jgi:hypothetical protein
MIVKFIGPASVCGCASKKPNDSFRSKISEAVRLVEWPFRKWPSSEENAMLQLRHIKHFCGAGGIIVALLCAPAAVVSIRGASAAEITQAVTHGVWHGFFAHDVGFGIETKTGDGGTVALVVKGQAVSLMMTSSDWRMTVGKTLPIRMKIDGESVATEALVVQGGMIAIKDVANDVVLRLARGEKVTFNIGSNGLVWNLSLNGFSETLTDTVKAYAGTA